MKASKADHCRGFGEKSSFDSKYFLASKYDKYALFPAARGCVILKPLKNKSLECFFKLPFFNVKENPGGLSMIRQVPAW